MNLPSLHLGQNNPFHSFLPQTWWQQAPHGDNKVTTAASSLFDQTQVKFISNVFKNLSKASKNHNFHPTNLQIW
jgi:hypothetical protein